MSRGNFFSVLAAILVALTLIFSSTQTAFANEESEKHNAQGMSYYNDEKYKEALNEFLAAIKIEQNNSSYFNNAGWAYFSLQQYAPAEENFNKAIKIGDGNPNPYRGLARVYRDQGKNEDAKKYFIEAGNKYYAQEKWNDVIIDLTDAINLGVGTAEVYDKRGWAYYNSENYKDAFTDFDIIIREIDANYVDAYNGRSTVYLKQGNNEGTQKDLYKAGEILYNKGDWHNAIAYFDRAIKLDGAESGNYRFSEAESYRLRGYAYTKLNDNDKALKDFNKAIEIFEKAIVDKTIAPDEYWNCADSYNGRGWVCYSQKKYNEAEADFKRGINLYKDYPYLFRGLANVYKVQATNDPSKKNLAKENYAKAGELFYKRSKDAWKNELQFAIGDFSDAIKLDENDAKLYYLRGLAYSESDENLDKAVADFTKAIKLDENYIDAYEKRAEVYNKQGNAAAATEDLKKATEIKPNPKAENFLDELSMKLVGEINPILVGLFIVMAIEFVTTLVRRRIHERDLTLKVAVSQFAIIMIFLLIIFAVDKLQDSLINSGMIISATIGLFLLWELLLIIDNAERLGAPVPEGLKDILKKIIDKIKRFFS